MKKITSVFIIAVIVAVSSFCAEAALAPVPVGDVNADGKITVTDATRVQKYVAKFSDFTLLEFTLADADDDSTITVKDATAIQRHVAKIKRIDRAVYPFVDAESFYFDYDSGKAMAGVPVTFTAVGDTSEALPLTYAFYVDDKLIEERSEKNSFTYTFEKAGQYKVEIVIYNEYDFICRCREWVYEVVDYFESETPCIRAFYSPWHYNNAGRFDPETKDIPFVAEAAGGNGDYKYAFYLDGKLIRDYSEDNTFIMENPPEKSEQEHILSVRVKDGLWEYYYEAEYIFEINYPPPA